MRVLHLNSAADWGGGEAHTLLLAQELRTAGCTVVLAGRPGSAITRRAEEVGVETLTLPLRGSCDFYSVELLAQFCKIHDIEIIHAHLARDYWLAYFTCLRYSALRMVLTRHLLYSLDSTPLHRMMFRRADAIIAVSGAVHEVLLRQPMIPAAKVVKVLNGIDTARYADAAPGAFRRAHNLSADCPLIGIVGTLSPHKGQALLIQALPAIRRNCPQAMLAIVGDDQKDGQYLAELRRQAATLGVTESVIFTGHSHDVAAAMRDFTIFALASQAEPFGLVLVEAMAAGRPVVATRAGGVSEIVIDGETGCLVPPNDTEALAQAISALLLDSTCATRWGKAGQARARANYDAQSMTRHTLAVYQQLITKAQI